MVDSATHLDLQYVDAVIPRVCYSQMVPMDQIINHLLLTTQTSPEARRACTLKFYVLVKLTNIAIYFEEIVSCDN